MKNLERIALFSSCVVVLGGNLPAVGASNANNSVVPATSQPQAQSVARSHAGRHDPMQDIGVGTFPHAPMKVANHHFSYPHSGVLKPPPPPVAVRFNDFGTGGQLDDLKPPSAIHELRLVSLMDDHAIIRVPGDIARKNGWPTTIALNPGEHIGSLKLIATTTTQATFEEDGLRLTKPLAP
jgi:hypothetical protein